VDLAGIGARLVSLINKMLSDLEQRHSYRKEQDEIVLGGLAPVANTGFSTPRLPYNFLLVCFFTLAIALASYGFWQTIDDKAVHPDETISRASVEPPTSAVIPLPAPDTQLAMVTPVAQPALKLDLSLPAVTTAPVAAIPPPIIDTVPDELQPVTVETVELLPMMETAMTASESGFGQMEIKPAAVSDTDPILRQLNEAKSAYSNRDYRRGDETLLAILQQEPLHIEARTVYASSLVGRGNIESAMQVLAAGLDMNPAVVKWAMLYAQLQVKQGNNAGAISILRRSLPAMENNEDYYAFYAALLQRQSRHEEAVNYYRNLLASKPDNGIWWLGLGISLEGTDNSEEALDSYKRALQTQSLNNELRQYVTRQIGRLDR